MLTHHSSLDYAVAATEAAAKAKDAMDAQIRAGQAKAEQVILTVQNSVPTDRIARGSRLDFATSIDGKGINVKIPTLDGIVEETMHRNALQQAASRVDMPLAYINSLVEHGEWGRELAVNNLRQLFGHLNGDKFLLRSVNGQVRGFLSDAYRRMDARPIMDAFIGAVQKYGAVPVDGTVTDTKVDLKVVLPYVFEPVPNEPMLIGARYGNSDFGNGLLQIALFVLRLWCTNMAVGESLLKKVHLGARIAENVAFSQRTYDLDTQTAASAVADIAEKGLGPEAVNQYVGLIKAANEQKVTGHQVGEFMAKNLTRAEAKEATEAFNSADIEQLPAGNTKWRMSNALSFLAKNAEPERRLELQRLAGSVLETK